LYPEAEKVFFSLSLALDLAGEAPDFDAGWMDNAGEVDAVLEVNEEPGLGFVEVVFPGYKTK